MAARLADLKRHVKIRLTSEIRISSAMQADLSSSVQIPIGLSAHAQSHAHTHTHSREALRPTSSELALLYLFSLAHCFDIRNSNCSGSHICNASPVRSTKSCTPKFQSLKINSYSTLTTVVCSSTLIYTLANVRIRMHTLALYYEIV